MSDFSTTDFVQVEHFQRLPGGEPSNFWRNALYVGAEELRGRETGNHIVIYTDGTRKELDPKIRIRKPRD